MSKTKVTTVFIWLTIFLFGMPKTYASAARVAAEDAYPSEFNELNFVSFEINVNETGSYYAEFWVMPATYTDGGYTKFSVYANGQFIGNIVPASDNWQAARIEGNERLPLQKGSNTVMIGVPSPEIPAVELVKVGATEKETQISSKAYDSFYNDASSGMTYDIPEEERFMVYSNDATQSSNAPEVSLKHFFDVPLKYTFHREFTFQQGQEVQISTSSSSEHDVDIIYRGSCITQFPKDSVFGTNCSSSHIGSEITDNVKSEDSSSSEIINTIIGRNKPTQILEEATSEESQGLNWKGCSFKSGSEDNNIISKTITIPKTGIYLIRLRHREAGKTGVANLYVNGRLAYRNVPISFSWVPCELSANGFEYGTLAKSLNPDVDDPMLFIHGAAADRVVGFGDDAPLVMRVIHELSYFDSHVLQEYKVRTSGISICSYSSNTPESSCYIIAGIDESVFDPGPEYWAKPKSSGHADQTALLGSAKDLVISNSLENSGVVIISAQSPIHNVTVADMFGTIISTFQLSGNELSISKEQLNSNRSGIYIVSVETENGTVSKKLYLD